MNRFTIAFAGFAAGVLLASGAQASDVKYVMKTPGVSCEGSSASAHAAVAKLEGVQSVVAAKSEHTVTVAFDDSAVAVDDIVNALGSAGYSVDSYSPAQ